MLKPRFVPIGLAMTLVVVSGAQAAQNAGNDQANTRNGSPVLELYRTDDGHLRYQLNNDWLLGMSLGVSPVDLADHTRGWRPLDKWRPPFGLYDLSTRSPGAANPPVVNLRRVRWFWTIGSTHDLGGDNPFDVKWDVLQRLSAHTQAGFLVPFGERWLFGGAVTLDREMSSQSSPAVSGKRTAESKTSAGAYLGFELAY